MSASSVWRVPASFNIESHFLIVCEAGEDEGGASGPGRLVGRRGEGEAGGLFEALGDPAVNDGLLGDVRVSQRGGAPRRDEGPVLGVLAALFHPAGENVPLGLGELLLGILGRHRVVLVVETKDDLGVLEIVRVDGVRTQNWQQVNLALADRLGETGSIVIDARQPGADAQVFQIPITNWQKLQ